MPSAATPLPPEGRTWLRRVVALGRGALLMLLVGVASAAVLLAHASAAATTSVAAVSATVTPVGAGTALFPGASGTFTVSITNPTGRPVRVLAVGAGSSVATGPAGACPGGTVTSSALDPGPAAIIPASGSGTFTLSSRMVDDPADSCQGRAFTLPLTATLAPAAG